MCRTSSFCCSARSLSVLRPPEFPSRNSRHNYSERYPAFMIIDTHSLKAFLETQLPTGLEMLRQMVSINSFTSNRDGVNRLGKLTADFFTPLGFKVEYVPSSNPDWGNHLILTRPGRSNKSLAMVSHLDTVFPPEEEI